MKKITFWFFVLLTYCQLNAQVSSYTFNQSSGTYTEFNDGTVLGTATGNAIGTPSLDSEIYNVTIPFSFNYNGNDYSDCNVSSNGFVAFGSVAPTTTFTTPISGTSGIAGAISAWGGDLNALFNLGGLTGDISWKVIGTAPNREFVVQYRNFRIAYSTSTVTAPYINFQISLSETSNEISIIYGNSGIAVGTANSSTTKQIGLRGAATSDFNNRTNATTVLFTSSTAGTLNTNTQAFSSVNATPGKPTSGLTYTWTAPSCFSPSGFSASNITINSATISWTAPTPAPSNGFEYYVSAVNTPPTGAGTSLTANTVNLSSLTANTTYYVWLRSNCGSEFSGLVGPFAFTTPCDFYTPSYTENFAAFPPACWTRAAAGTPATGPTGTATGIWAADGFLNSGTTGAVKVNLYSLNRIGWLISPTINMSAGNYRVKFDYAVTAWGATTSSAMGSDDIVQLVASQDGGVTWQVVTTFDAASNVSNANNTFVLALPTYTSANTKFAFYATDGAVDDTPDYDFFVDNFVIETVPTCPGPTALLATNPTATGISLAWTSAASNFQYVVQAQGTGTPVAAGTVVTGATTAAVSGLTANTAYEVWVRTDCTGSGNGFSTWTGPVNFSTACTSYIPSYTENFATFPPACWSRAAAGTPATGPTGTATGIWEADGFLNNGATGAVKVNLYFTNRIGWLISPTINMSAGNYRVKFDYAVTTWNATTASPMGSDDVVELYASQDNGATWQLITSLGAANNITNTSNTFIAALPAYTNANTKFAFYATDGVTDDTPDYDFFIDNFVIETVPTCVGPTALLATNPTTTGVNLTWTSAASNFQYVIQAQGTGMPAAAGTVVTGATTVAVSGLTANTAYEVWVRTDCSGSSNGFSTWTGPVNFNTACNAANIPYTMDFESAVVPALPNCTSVVNAAAGNVWTTASAPGSGFTTKALRYGYNSANPANTWFFTQSVNLVAGTSYRITYDYGSASTFYTEKLKVAYGTSASAAAMSTVIMDHPAITGTTLQSNLSNFTPSTTGVYYIGFQAYSIADQLNLYVDNIVLDVTPLASPDYANLQFPGTITITQGGSEVVYGQVYEAGLTDVAPNVVGQAPGILAWIGVSPVGSNTNPNTWTSWTPMTWNAGNVSNNDEYQATIGATLAPGTYYYATRFNLGAGSYVYGGFSASNGGFWNGTTNISGVLTVNPFPVPANDACAGATALTVGINATSNVLSTTNNGATLSAQTPIPSCGAFNFATNAKDVWYTVTVPSSGNVIIETDLNGGLTDSVIQVYSGACGALVALSCDDDGGNGNMSLVNVTGQMPGNVLLIRVHGFDGAQGTFTIAAYDCPSATPAPTGSAAQAFCSAAAPTVASLVATGTAIKWYDAATAGNLLASTTALVSGTIYYASQTLTCESFNRLAVTATVTTNPAAPTASAAQTFCSAAAPTVASLVATGTAIQWYDAATAGNLLASTTALVSGNMYYASQTVSTCESTTRVAVTATITANPAAPTASASQTFCSAAAPTVASLVATGTAIQWYDSATAGNLLASTTALVSGNIYYASQTVSTCESTTRVAVTATINANPAIPTGNASQTYCAAAGNTIANLVVTGTNLVWYDAATLGNVLPTSTVLTSTTYYVASTNGTCESPRLAITTTENCPVAGCLTAPSGQWPSATFVPNPALCDGIAVQNVTTSGWAGEYSVVTVTLGQTYIFSSSVATDIVTISADAGATVAAAGIGSVTWVSTLAGNIRFYTHLTGCGAETVSRTRRLVCGVPSTDAPDYANLQFPATINIVQGGTSIVYGQVYEGGLTDVAPNITGQAPGITAWVGISPVGSNTNPNTWTNWIPATWNAGNVGNNDEYQATIGATLVPGTYYYATRFRLNLGPYVYGGYTATGGGFWNSTTNISGVLTVSPPPAPANDDCSGAIALTPGGVFNDNPLAGTTFGATTSTVTIPVCPTFAPAGNSDVWYSVVIPASGTVTVETQASVTNPVGDTVIVAFSGTCGTLTPITCNDDTGGLYSTINVSGVAGSTIYIGVWKYGTIAPTNTVSDFRISAYDGSLSNAGFDSASFTYYPNPVKDILNLSYSQNISQVEVYNLVGQKMTTNAYNENNVQIDMSRYPTGVYLVNVTANNITKTVRVIKE